MGLMIGMGIGVFGATCVGLIYPLLLWYFMTRPHVVAAFLGVSSAEGLTAWPEVVAEPWSPAEAKNPYVAPRQAAPPPPVPMSGTPFSTSESIVETFVPSRNGPALVAYYCGIFALFPCLGFPLGVVAVYYGLQGLRRERENPQVRGGVHAWVGVICGALFGFFNLLLCVAAAIAIIAAATGQH
jgi:hypothetical protein